MSSDTPPQSDRRKSRSIIAWFAVTALVVAAMLLQVFYRDAVEQAFNWVPGWIVLLTMVLLVLVVTGVIVCALIRQNHPRLALATQRVGLVLLAALMVSLALTALSGQLPDTSHHGPGELGYEAAASPDGGTAAETSAQIFTSISSPESEKSPCDCPPTNTPTASRLIPSAPSP